MSQRFSPAIGTTCARAAGGRQEQRAGSRRARSQRRLGERDRAVRTQALELGEARAQLATNGQQLESLRLQYETAAGDAANVEEKVKLQVQTARVVADAAAQFASKATDIAELAYPPRQ